MHALVDSCTYIVVMNYSKCWHIITKKIEFIIIYKLHVMHVYLWLDLMYIYLILHSRKETGWGGMGEEIRTGPEDRCDTSKDCLHVRQCPYTYTCSTLYIERESRREQNGVHVHGRETWEERRVRRMQESSLR